MPLLIALYPVSASTPEPSQTARGLFPQAAPGRGLAPTSHPTSLIDSRPQFLVRPGAVPRGDIPPRTLPHIPRFPAGSSMKPDKLTVFELFDKQRQYTVPLFQRSYRWTEDKQWAPLWADIEREAKTAFIKLSRQEPLNSTHFMGAVVLSVDQIIGRGIARVQIIDGQQRLITLQIVLAALRDYAAPLDEDLSQDAAHLTRNNSRADLSRDDVLKVRPSSSNRTMFHKVMSAQSVTQIRADHLKTAAQRKSDASRIAAAYVFFYDKDSPVRVLQTGRGRSH